MAPRHTFRIRYHTPTDMWSETQEDSNLLTPEGYPNVDAFSTPDWSESYSPTDDPFMKYTEDPPALIA